MCESSLLCLSANHAWTFPYFLVDIKWQGNYHYTWNCVDNCIIRGDNTETATETESSLLTDTLLGQENCIRDEMTEFIKEFLNEYFLSMVGKRISSSCFESIFMHYIISIRIKYFVYPCIHQLKSYIVHFITILVVTYF